jgi:hypothetical protein
METGVKEWDSGRTIIHPPRLTGQAGWGFVARGTVETGGLRLGPAERPPAGRPPPRSTAGCGKPHVRRCGKAPGRNTRHPARSMCVRPRWSWQLALAGRKKAHLREKRSGASPPRGAGPKARPRRTRPSCCARLIGHPQALVEEIPQANSPPNSDALIPGKFGACPGLPW